MNNGNHDWNTFSLKGSRYAANPQVQENQPKPQYDQEPEKETFFNKLIRNKFFKIAVYCLAAILSGWLFLNLFITPINRILGLPNVSNLENYSPISSIEVYDKNDQFVTVLQGEEDRQIVELSNVSMSLKQALFASEDREFFQHSGINFMGIFRAVLVNLQTGRLKQGGSTITQQLVKNIFFSPKEWSTISRKFKEALLTIEVEKKYSKEQILEFYLNQIYWGKGAYGVERAAKRYFNKSAAELSIAESAYLVALLPSPSTLHLIEEAFQRQRQIIRNMTKYGYITEKQADRAIRTQLHFESAPGNLSKFPYYMSVVLDELRSRFSEQELRHMGLKVYTGIDQEAQAVAEKDLEEGIKKAPFGISQGALVTIDVPSNEVRVIVGGVGDFWKHQWNRATSAHTIGSAFKPFVYLTAFMKGLYSSNSVIMDTPYSYTNPETGEFWAPKNFDGKFWGELTIRKALVNSRNIPAIRVAEKSTMESVIETANKVGITEVAPYLSSALGSSAVSPLKAANAYAVLARGGIYMKPVIIKRISSRNGKVIEQNNVLPERVLPSGPVYELIDILLDVVDHGTGVMAKIKGLQIAGKTGTADGSRDVWFIGFTPDTVTALWGGNDKNQKASSSATGGVVMASIWKNFMTEYYTINPTPANYFPKPAKRIRLLIDPITGLLATGDSFQPEYREFIPGTEPKKYAPAPTPEQIEKYLEVMEKQRSSEETEETTEEEEAEQALLGNQEPKAISESLMNPNEMRPVLERPSRNTYEAQPQPSPQYNQNPNYLPPPPEDPNRRPRFTDRFRDQQPTQGEEPQGDEPKPRFRDKLKRLFTSPY